MQLEQKFPQAGLAPGQHCVDLAVVQLKDLIAAGVLESAATPPGDAPHVSKHKMLWKGWKGHGMTPLFHERLLSAHYLPHVLIQSLLKLVGSNLIEKRYCFTSIPLSAYCLLHSFHQMCIIPMQPTLIVGRNPDSTVLMRGVLQAFPVVVRLEALTDEGRAEGLSLAGLEPGCALPHWVQSQTT